MKTFRHNAGFTLVEVLVSSGIVVVIMGVLLTMTDQTQRLVRSTSSKVEQFQDARVGFEAMTRRLAQATLNTFWDYKYVNNIPVEYQRSAELRFRSGQIRGLTGGTGANGNPQVGHGIFFQAPMGMVADLNALGALDHLINTWGYFVEVGDDANDLPTFLRETVPIRKRYRLMEMMQPSEQLGVYTPQAQGLSADSWYKPFTIGANRPVRVLTENVVALVVLPRLSVADEEQWKRLKGSSTPPILAQNFAYNSTVGNIDPILNSKHQLPPVVQIVMVAIDEPSAQRLQDQNGGDPHLGINYDPDPFSGRALFSNPSLLQDNASTGALGDISRLEKLLTSKKASYRVFATNVSIRGAKWSRSQTN